MDGNCFVKPLDRDSTKPPADFWDLIQKIRVRSCVQSCLHSHFLV